MWIAGGKCGLTWELMQVQVPERIALTGFAFADDDEDIVADAVDDNKDEYVVDSDEDLWNQEKQANKFKKTEKKKRKKKYNIKLADPTLLLKHALLAKLDIASAF